MSTRAKTSKASDTSNVAIDLSDSIITEDDKTKNNTIKVKVERRTSRDLVVSQSLDERNINNIVNKNCAEKPKLSNSTSDKKLKSNNKSGRKFVTKLANSGLRLLAWGTHAPIIQDNGKRLFEQARENYLKSL